MNFTYSKTNWNNIQILVNNYLSEIGDNNDGFWNDMVFEAEPYTISIDNNIIGFFTIGNTWDEGKMFRAIYFQPNMRRYARNIFEELIKQFDISAALVASNDEHFICLSFETMQKLKTSFEMQAYNFTYGKPLKEAKYPIESIVKVLPEDYEKMNALTENQWDGCFDNPNNQFYALKADDKIIGYGSIIPLAFNKNHADIGNFTLPEYRMNGVGRSLIIHLTEIAKNQNLTPVCGCWYGNTESIATLQSSGFIPNSRIFYVKFK